MISRVEHAFDFQLFILKSYVQNKKFACTLVAKIGQQ